MRYFSYVCIMKPQQEDEQQAYYQGMEPFKIVLNGKFYPWDILESSSEEYTVISSQKTPEGYVTRMAPIELILHKQFLWKYSQFMWGFE